MKAYLSVISIAALILTAIGISDTSLGHFVQHFPGLSGSGIGLVAVGIKSMILST